MRLTPTELQSIRECLSNKQRFCAAECPWPKWLESAFEEIDALRAEGDVLDKMIIKRDEELVAKDATIAELRVKLLRAVEIGVRLNAYIVHFNLSDSDSDRVTELKAELVEIKKLTEGQ